jgi:transcriptional regulator with XRE-family HTH domain
MKPLRTIVAERLNDLRITQKELSDRAGLSPTYINELVKGKKDRIQRRFVEKLALALEIEPDVLYDKTGRAKKKPIASTTPAASRSTIIRAHSPETAALFSNEMPMFQSDPAYEPDRHVPLFIEAVVFRPDIAGPWKIVAKFRPFVWPEFLGPSKGCYAMTSRALHDNTLFADSVFLVAPGHGIKSGDVFVGQFQFIMQASNLQVRRLLGATDEEFVLSGINGGDKFAVPRRAIMRFHKVVGLFEQPD